MRKRHPEVPLKVQARGLRGCYARRRRVAQSPAIATNDAKAITPYSPNVGIGVGAGVATAPTLITMVSLGRFSVRVPGVRPRLAKVPALKVDELTSGEPDTYPAGR